MATKQVSLPDIGAVMLYKRRGNRSLRLTIGSDGEVKVSMPYWVPYAAGERFALSKTQWILANRGNSTTVLAPGNAIGKAHRILFQASADVETVQTRVAANEVRVQYPSVYTYLDRPVQQAAQRAGKQALRKEATVLLPQRLHALSVKTGLSYTGVDIKLLKSRWGSCNVDRKITLNLYLMQLPWRLIDYVLVHELVHTKVMRHGKPFWDEMERHIPGARTLRKQVGAYKPHLSPADRNVA